MRATTLAVCGLVLAAGISLDAQWLKLPTPGLPRLPDGKPNLEAPAPRTADGKPDFSGLWSNDGGDRLYNNIAVDLPVSDVAPWAHQLFIKRLLPSAAPAGSDLTHSHAMYSITWHDRRNPQRPPGHAAAGSGPPRSRPRLRHC